MFKYCATTLLVVLLPLVIECRHLSKEQQSCDELDCCPGTACKYNKQGIAECKKPSSCDQTECQNGFRCILHGDHNKLSHIHCRVSCKDIICPKFTECVERGYDEKSQAVCRIPQQQCTAQNCTQGLECKEKHRHSLCVARNCTGIDCGNGGECREGHKNRISDGKILHLLPRSHKELLDPMDSQHDHHDHHDHTHQFGTCIPICSNNTCPQGLYCEQHHHEVICRPPRSCQELNCPVGQTCQSVACKKHVLVPFDLTRKSHKRNASFKCVETAPITSSNVSPTKSVSRSDGVSSSTAGTISYSTTIATTTIAKSDSSSISYSTTIATTTIAKSDSSSISPTPSQVEEPVM